jgi:hypothetical protein
MQLDLAAPGGGPFRLEFLPTAIDQLAQPAEVLGGASFESG